MAKKGKETGCMVGTTRSPSGEYVVSHPNLRPDTLGKGMSNIMTGGSKRAVIRTPMTPLKK
jgi:hypothetical protein